MASPYFSIIIPCYNAQSTLGAAVDSVLSQDYTDFEIIIVDDASSDWSFALAQELTEKDERVRLIALADNNGPAVARNKAIEEARGKYLMFLDSDDIYEPGLLSKVQAASAEEPDVVIWGNIEEYINDAGEATGTRDILPTPATLGSAEEVHRIVMDLEEASFYGYLWNKAYKASIAQQLHIPNQHFNEDEMYNISYFNEVNSAVVLDFAGTRYRKCNKSLTHRELVDYYPLAMKRVTSLMLQHKIWNIYTPMVRERLANIYLRYIASTLERSFRQGAAMGDRSRKLMLQRIFSSRLYREFAAASNPGNPLLKVLKHAMVKKNATACLAVGKMIYRTRKTLPAVFEAGQKR